jgi:hypothetical protein
MTDKRTQAAAGDATVSGAAVSSPGGGSDPKAAAAAGAGSQARPAPPGARVEGPEKPELYVAAAFVGAFLFARILKRIAE